jgi:hypothetical protein
MLVFICYLLSAALAGILMRRRPFVQTQAVLALLTGVVAVCYLVFGML